MVQRIAELFGLEMAHTLQVATPPAPAKAATKHMEWDRWSFLKQKTNLAIFWPAIIITSDFCYVLCRIWIHWIVNSQAEQSLNAVGHIKRWLPIAYLDVTNVIDHMISLGSLQFFCWMNFEWIWIYYVPKVKYCSEKSVGGFFITFLWLNLLKTFWAFKADHLVTFEEECSLVNS